VLPMCTEAMQVLKDGHFNPEPTTAIDPPQHTRIRQHFIKALSFTPARINDLRPWIEERATRLIDRIAPLGQADLVAELTTPLPAQVVFHLVGFPEEDGEQLLDWCSTRLKMSFGIVDAAEQVATARDMVNYWRYCVDFVQKCQSSPGDNITTQLLEIHAQDPNAISIREIASFLYGLIVAGHETTNHAIAGTLQLLLESPGQWQALQADRNLVRNAFEEGLRVEPPIAAWRRITTRDTEVGGVALPKGAELLLHLGSAGHDSQKFESGETFVPDRKNARAHLAFGYGVHLCLGAPLARAEGEVVLNLLLDRFPDLSLVPGQEYEYLPNLVIRGSTKLLARWTPRN